MSLLVGAPDRKHHGRLVWPFGEDAVTAAYELVGQAGLGAGTGVAVHGLELPAWWWLATGLQEDARAKWRLDGARTSLGDAVVLTDEGAQPVEGHLSRALGAARTLGEDEAEGLARALDPSPRPVDLPLGAHVIAPRHEAVLLERLRMPGGTVRTWTAIGPGAAPSEFRRMQDALGTYHVVLVDQGGAGRTVGIWTGQKAPATGQEVRPVLRRLFIREGRWRYGVAFAPTL